MTISSPSDCEETTPSDVDIVLIHGLNGHAFNTYGDVDVDDFRSYWPRHLPQDFQSARIWTFGYDADILSATARHSIDERGTTGNPFNSRADGRGRGQSLVRRSLSTTTRSTAQATREASKCWRCEFQLPSLSTDSFAIESIHDLAEKILRHIDAPSSPAVSPASNLDGLQQKSWGYQQASRPLLFICHSIGGIVAQQALHLAHSRLQSGVADRTLGIIMLDDPICPNISDMSPPRASERAGSVTATLWDEDALSLAHASSRLFQYIGWKYRVVRICRDGHSTCAGKVSGFPTCLSALTSPRRPTVSALGKEWPMQAKH